MKGAPRTITVVVTDRGHCVHEGERFSGDLSWDEMLGQVAMLTLPRGRVDVERGLFGMRTPEERDAERAQRMRRWMPQQCDLSEPAREAVHALGA